jgi:ribosomal protein S18 acetylase RimI-like enzyme
MLIAIPVTDQFQDIEKIEALAAEAFPPEEYLSPAAMIQMSKSAGFDFWALYDQETFVGFMTVMTNKELAYLFFLAIEKSCRSSGYGSKALQALRRIYPGKKQVVDMEKLDDSAANQLQRERRRSFYIGNGYKATGQFLSYLGVDYEVLCMDTDFDLEMFKKLMTNVQIPGFALRYFTE